MEIKVTVHLKSGGDLVSGHYGEEVHHVAKRFTNIFTDKESKVLFVDDGRNIQMIPRDNVAAITILEVR